MLNIWNRQSCHNLAAAKRVNVTVNTAKGLKMPNLTCERCRQPSDELIGAKNGSKWCRTCSYVANNWHGRTSQPKWCPECKMRGQHKLQCSRRCSECELEESHTYDCSHGIYCGRCGRKGHRARDHRYGNV